jgi:hypothetical protein
VGDGEVRDHDAESVAPVAVVVAVQVSGRAAEPLLERGELVLERLPGRPAISRTRARRIPPSAEVEMQADLDAGREQWLRAARRARREGTDRIDRARARGLDHRVVVTSGVAVVVRGDDQGAHRYRF